MNKSLIKKFYIFFTSVFIFLIHVPFVFAKINSTGIKISNALEVKSVNSADKRYLNETPCISNRRSIYDSLGLGTLGLCRQAFDNALKGLNYLISKGKLHDRKILSIVDFSLPSSKKRLFILDLENYKILFNTYVAHGRNSGRETATQFSNQEESYQSSLGFYVTQETYSGKHGYSLHLEGEERGINDHARSREIVMHSAAYVNESIIRSRGFIGRSLGCPALPENMHKPIIEKIKNGTCLFLYSPDKYYAAHSAILQAS